MLLDRWYAFACLKVSCMRARTLMLAYALMQTDILMQMHAHTQTYPRASLDLHRSGASWTQSADASCTRLLRCPFLSSTRNDCVCVFLPLSVYGNMCRSICSISVQHVDTDANE